MKLLIKNGALVLNDGVKKLDILLKTERLQK